MYHVIATDCTCCLQEARRFHSLTALGGILVAAGGYNANSGRLKSVELLSLGKGRETAWITAEWSLDEEVAGHCAVALSEHELVIIGGYSNRKASRIGNNF